MDAITSAKRNFLLCALKVKFSIFLEPESSGMFVFWNKLTETMWKSLSCTSEQDRLMGNSKKSWLTNHSAGHEQWIQTKAVWANQCLEPK